MQLGLLRVVGKLLLVSSQWLLVFFYTVLGCFQDVLGGCQVVSMSLLSNSMYTVLGFFPLRIAEKRKQQKIVPSLHLSVTDNLKKDYRQIIVQSTNVDYMHWFLVVCRHISKCKFVRFVQEYYLINIFVLFYQCKYLNIHERRYIYLRSKIA